LVNPTDFLFDKSSVFELVVGDFFGFFLKLFEQEKVNISDSFN